ncbi:O-antigen ligase family protein [Helicobacter kayseriensis]|uniref:O-antigen ligase family protein n=1 Tax=Helicobacter kayseriensis TaxID=2905877 RepID=UPI001E4AC6ED|nr:O-antigen ligase family protein [Helicobacter kayseriensis]MCE3047672.1 O-antigen ligase family protein [Helicobacter kayseriensis]MCE3049090.1 O-antigen ligase family protein [Helicobacter kayseriensis]
MLWNGYGGSMMNGQRVTNDFLSYWISALVFILCLGTAYRHMSMVVEVLLALSLCVAYFASSKDQKPLEKNEKLFILALILFFLSAVLSYLAGSGWELKSARNPSMPSLTDLDTPSKYLLGALVFYLFIKLDFRIYYKALCYGIALGGIANGCIGIYQRYILGVGRVYGWSGITEMADSSAILGILSLLLLIFADSKKEKVLYFAAMFLSCLASVLTGTRGAMLGMILTFAFVGGLLCWKHRKKIKSYLWAICICFLGLCSIVGLGDGKSDFLRLEIAHDDLERYHQGEIDKNSIGARFEMWKEAATMFQMAPFLGLSTAEILQRMPEITEKSRSMIKREQTYQEAIGTKHNQILNQAAKRGAVGVLVLLFVWFASVKLFFSSFRRGELFAFAGICMIFYFIFPNALIGDPWESNVSFPLMTLFICIFWKMIHAGRGNAN